MIQLDKLRKFVSALEAAATMNPSLRTVDLQSIHKPTCGTPGCHAGLAKEALDILGVEPISDGYDFCAEAYRLSNYLIGEESAYEPAMSPRELHLCQWAKAHPTEWGSRYGEGMFTSGVAFNRESYTFPARDLVEWWQKVLERLEAKEPRSSKELGSVIPAQEEQ